MTCNVDGAELRIDGAVVGTLPISSPVRVTAGAHNMQIRANGYGALRFQMQVATGQTASRPVRLAQREGNASNVGVVGEEGGETRSGSTQRILGWVALAAGTVGVGVGVGSYFVTQGAISDYDRTTCPGTDSARTALQEPTEEECRRIHGNFDTGIALPSMGALSEAGFWLRLD